MLLEALVPFSAKRYPLRHFGTGMKTLCLISMCVTYRGEPDCVLRSMLSMEARSKLRRRGGRYVCEYMWPTFILDEIEGERERKKEGRMEGGERYRERNGEREREVGGGKVDEGEGDEGRGEKGEVGRGKGR